MTFRMMGMAVLAGGVLVLGACRSVQPQEAPRHAAAANEKYSFGAYNAEFNSTLFNVDKAVRAACRRAKLIELSRVNRSSTCTYEYKDVDGNSLNIFLLEKAGLVRITLRVGRTGDKISSQTLLDAIAEELALL